MEPLIFAIIAAGTGYKQNESFVPEPAEFLPFDLRALERSYSCGGQRREFAFKSAGIADHSSRRQRIEL